MPVRTAGDRMDRVGKRELVRQKGKQRDQQSFPVHGAQPKEPVLQIHTCACICRPSSPTSPSARHAVRCGGDCRHVARLHRKGSAVDLDGGAHRERHSRTETNVVVAGENVAIIGFGIMFYASEDAHLLLFAVRRAHQRRGVGSAILRWLEDVARAAGAKRIRVECTRENSVAGISTASTAIMSSTSRRRCTGGLKDGVHLEKWFRESA